MVVKYLPRILDEDLEKYLTMIGAILIVGPKWCGKTTTAEQHAKSVLKLQDKDNYKTNMMWADIEPSRLLKGNKPPKRFDSLTNYFLEGLSVSYAEYSKDILYPYVNKRLSTNTYTYEKFKEMFSLKSSSDFIKANGDNIIYLTSADDLLMTKEDFAYVNSTFKNKIILPYGGHTGILWHKEVSKLMVDKLEEGGTK